MTVDQFFKELAKLPKKGWVAFTDHADRIRLHRPNKKEFRLCDCPITAVCFASTDKSFSRGSYYEAAKKLGLKMSPADNIARGADNKIAISTERKYRRRLLKALNIKEAA